MKKLIALVLVASFLFAGCASQKNIDGVTYQPYGLFNEGEQKSDKVKYETSIGNVIWGIIGFETIIVPVYCFAFALYQPVTSK